jgi:pimeloyl-ACP methyl ester carboxylesterase
MLDSILQGMDCSPPSKRWAAVGGVEWASLQDGPLLFFPHGYLIIWGEQDWSTARERESDNRLIPGARVVTVSGGGHFLPLDRPDAVVEELKAFVVPRPTNR